MINNLLTLKVTGKTVLAQLVETLNYNVQEVDKPRETQLEEPKFSIGFNTVGGLVEQKGELPAPAKQADPCDECLKQMNAQASSVEGGVDDCSYSCDDEAMKQFEGGKFFTISSPAAAKPGAEASPAPSPASGG